MPVLSLILTPADVSLFREPRPFDETGGNALSLLPSPQTAAGAVRTWLLRGSGVSLTGLGKDVRGLGSIRKALERRCPPGHRAHWVLDASLRGPMLCHASGGNLLLPVPMHLAWSEGEQQVRRLLPLSQPPPGFTAPDGDLAEFRPAGRPAAEELAPLEGYLPEAVFAQYGLRSSDPVPPALTEKLRATGTIYQMEPRVGLGVDSDRNAALPGRLYSVSFLRLWDGTGRGIPPRVAFRVDVETEADVQNSVETLCRQHPWLWLGGESRPAHVALAATSLPLPRKTAPAVPERFCTYLMTPGLFEKGKWYPQRLTQACDLVSAVVGAPSLHAGWDVAQGQPQPARLAVRAGAVHFWQVRDPDHPPPDPHGTCLSDSPEDCQAGWGLCLRGEWDYV